MNQTLAVDNMPNHQVSLDEDRTITNETHDNTLSNNENLKLSGAKPSNATLSSVINNNADNGGGLTDCSDTTIRTTEHHFDGLNPILAKITVKDTFSIQLDDTHQWGPSNGDRADFSSNHQHEFDKQQVLYAELNDVVHIVRQLNEKWFFAKSDQLSGKLPVSSFRFLDVPKTLCCYLIQSNIFDLYVCFASFVAQDVGDLSLTRGDIIIGINRVNEHWMQGQVCFDGQTNAWPHLIAGKQMGSFPLNHCWRMDSSCVQAFCRHRIAQETADPLVQPSSMHNWPSILHQRPLTSNNSDSSAQLSQSSSSRRLPLMSTAHSSSLSSRSSSAFSTNENHYSATNRHYKFHDTTDNSSQNSNNNNGFSNNYASQSNNNINFNFNIGNVKPPPRPSQLPTNFSSESFHSGLHKSASEQAVVVMAQPVTGGSVLASKQQDKLKGWLHTVRKKTARLSTRITASLGLISLTRDEEFDRHYESFKQLEVTLRTFIKNITAFVEHYESFLLALQHTSDNICDFYRDKSQNQKELAELKRKNKTLQCEHFHEFRRTVDRQVISVCSELLKKFAGPHQLISKRTAKLIDYDTKTKEMESCRDIEKKARLRDQYVIAKELYDRLNGQLIHELPLFNQFALDIFRECILVLLESRRNLIMAYTKQTASLLETPLMASYTASDVASSILMSCNTGSSLKSSEQTNFDEGRQSARSFDNTAAPSNIRVTMVDDDKLSNNRQISSATQPSGSSGNEIPFSDDTSASRPHSALSQLSSELDHIANEMVPREISSTPLSQASINNAMADVHLHGDSLDENDGVVRSRVRIDISRISSGSLDNRCNESIESRIVSGQASPHNLNSAPTPPRPPRDQAVADSDLEDNKMHKLKSHLNGSGGGETKSKRRNKKTHYPVYVASWPFVATGPNQLTIMSDQQVKLIKDSDECGNTDWSLVRDKKGQSGYVPSSYIKQRE